MLKVNEVTHDNGSKIKVTLSDGQSGLFDVNPYTEFGFFKELASEAYLKLVKVDGSGKEGCWPNEQDFSADTLEAELIK